MLELGDIRIENFKVLVLIQRRWWKKLVEKLEGTSFEEHLRAEGFAIKAVYSICLLKLIGDQFTVPLTVEGKVKEPDLQVEISLYFSTISKVLSLFLTHVR